MLNDYSLVPTNCAGSIEILLSTRTLAACYLANDLAKDSAYASMNLSFDMCKQTIENYVQNVVAGGQKFVPDNSAPNVVNPIVQQTGYTSDQVYAMLYKLYQEAQVSGSYAAQVITVAPSAQPNVLNTVGNNLSKVLTQLPGALGSFFGSIQNITKYLPYVVVIGGAVYVYSWLPKKRST